MSIILGLKEDPKHYTEEFFTIAAYKRTYEQPLFYLNLTNVNGDAIHSLDSADESEESDEDEDDSVLPPATRRPPGRPKKRRIRGEHEACEKHPFHCSRCGDVGHSRS